MQSLRHLRDPKVRAAVAIRSHARRMMADYLLSRGFVEISPVIVAPVTDPLNHPVADPKVDYYGHEFQLTRSMIFHKQIAMLAFDKVFSLSPNLRFEPIERKTTGRHLVEFTQLDLEVKGATRDDAMDLAEGLLSHVTEGVRRSCSGILSDLGRKPPTLSTPFDRITWAEAFGREGKDFESRLSRTAKMPLWITDIPLQEREFYDKEDPTRPGTLLDMDLIYPEGFGEAISGGERESDIESILRRIRLKGQTPEQFGWYLLAAEQGLPPSAGFGIGMERLVRWLCGLEDVKMTALFPKVIGEWSL